MQCKDLEAVLTGEQANPLSSEAQEHLAGCSACRDLMADFSAIVDTAKRMPAEVNPPERIWVSLRAQLQAEGIIREVEIVEATAAASWWNGFAQFFRPRPLATVAAVLFLAVGSLYLVKQRTRQRGSAQPTPIASATAPVKAPEAPKVAEAVPTQTASAIVPKHSESANKPARSVAPSQPRPATGELLPSPSELAGFAESAATLNQTESALPARELTNNAAVDALLRQNLRTLNEFIAECEARLKQNPRDQLTREYLNTAYQQKAELLSAMMDSGRSEH